jgi:VanZ family protein
MRDSAIRLLRNARLWQIALACYWAALFIATHIPADRLPRPAQTADKLAHLLAFAGLSWLFATTWELSAGRLNSRHLVRAWFLLALYGALEEATQPLVGRHASVFDWLADMTGAALGLVLFAWMRRKFERVN